MAEKTKNGNKVIGTTRDDETGEAVNVTFAHVLEGMSGDRRRRRQSIIDDSYSLIKDYGDEFTEIDVHPTLDFLEGGVMPLEELGDAGLRPGRYFILYVPSMEEEPSGDELSRRREDGINWLLLATDRDQAVGSGISAKAITLTPWSEDGGPVEDAPFTKLKLWLIQIGECTSSYVSFDDLKRGISSLATLQLAFERGDVCPGSAGAATEIGVVAPRQGTARPRKQIDPNSKLANKITELNFGAEVALDVSGKNERKKSVLTVVTLEYDGNDVNLSKPMTEFDREVHNAVTTLWLAGNQSFTARQVWHALTGTGSDKPPTKQQIARIEKSIDKQRFTRAIVDFSKEARGRDLELDGEPVTTYQIDSYMLNADKHKIETANGRMVEGYTVNEKPVLYRHSAMFGQVVSYSMRSLSAASSVGQNTDENIIIRKYLLRRIFMAKGKSKTSRRVRYEGVYERVGISNPNKKQRKRLNDSVIACLEACKAEKVIKGFTEYFEGRMRAGVDLDL